MKQLKTGRFERKAVLAKAGTVSATRWLGSQTLGLFVGKEKRQAIKQKTLSREAQYLVKELGKLKGSIVKAGQMMALYGEHVLPAEITEALHTLEDQTQVIEWPVIEAVLIQQLGQQKLSELEVESYPIGAASLGQVHRAEIKATGEQICLKVQYPGVSEAIDSDVNTLASLLRMTHLVTRDKIFESWLEDMRVMLKREVDYEHEAIMTRRFYDVLSNDVRFIVPKVHTRYCNDLILATSYEEGLAPNDPKIAKLPVSRRSEVAHLFLELFMKEMFEWRTMQTDPNFGNYRIRLSEEGNADKIVLLDFGSVTDFTSMFTDACGEVICGGFYLDRERILDGTTTLGVMDRNFPEAIQSAFADLCIDIMEPFERVGYERPAFAVNSKGAYKWGESQLPKRVGKKATRNALSRYFRVPPKEFMFLVRKLMGVYTFISVLGAEFNCNDLLARYLEVAKDNN